MSEPADNFEDFNNYLKENLPGSAASRETTFTAKCIDEKVTPMDMLLSCQTSSDCADTWGHFNGGCCGRATITQGDLSSLDEDTRAVFALQE